MQTGEQIQRDLLTWGGYAVGIIGALEAKGVELDHGSILYALLTDPVFMSIAAVIVSSAIVRIRRSRLVRTGSVVLDGLEALVEARVQAAVAAAAARRPVTGETARAPLPGPPG